MTSSVRAADAPPPATALEAGPPPGAPADQDLWRTGNEVSDRILIERARANRLQVQARADGYEARLDALASDPSRAKAAAKAKDRLVAAWTATTDLMLQRWPVDPTRGCRYDLLNFETALRDDNPGRQEATLPEARTRLSRCVKQAQAVLAPFTASCDEFAAALREADAVLAPPAAPADR